MFDGSFGRQGMTANSQVFQDLKFSDVAIREKGSQLRGRVLSTTHGEKASYGSADLDYEYSEVSFQLDDWTGNAETVGRLRRSNKRATLAERKKRSLMPWSSSPAVPQFDSPKQRRHPPLPRAVEGQVSAAAASARYQTDLTWR